MVCPKCDHIRQLATLRLDRLKKQADTYEALQRIIPPEYREAKVSDLNSQLVRLLLSPHKGVILWGACGRGKTYAMAALLRRLVSNGVKCRRMGFEELLRQIRGIYDGTRTQANEAGVLNPLFTCRVLVLEDVGLASMKMESDFATKTLLAILDRRIENNLVTFMTTNKPFEAFRVAFDERITSRLLRYTWIEMTGPDRRNSPCQKKPLESPTRGERLYPPYDTQFRERRQMAVSSLKLGPMKGQSQTLEENEHEPE